MYPLGRGAYISALIILLFLVVLVYIIHGEVSGYSVVYFDNSTLPQYLHVGTTSNIVFIISSYENGVVNYSFNVYLNGVLIKNGTVSLKPGQSIQIPVTILVKNITYQRIVLQNTTTIYALNGVINITTSCVPLNSSTSNKWSCSPPIYKGPNGLNFVLNSTRNISINQTVSSVENNTSVITNTNISIVRKGYQRYVVTIRTVKWIKTKRNVNLEIIVRSSKGKVYMITHRFPVVGG